MPLLLDLKLIIIMIIIIKIIMLHDLFLVTRKYSLNLETDTPSQPASITLICEGGSYSGEGAILGATDSVSCEYVL